MRFLVFIFLSFWGFETIAQEIGNKTLALSIKKNSDFLYGEDSDENYAFSLLLDKVRNLRETNARIDTSSAFLKSKIQKLTYEKFQGKTVVLLYVTKNELSGEVSDNFNGISESEVESGTENNVSYEIPNVVASEHEVIADVSRLNSFSEILNYLKNRKLQHHDIQFKALRNDDGTRNCYWIVFDNNQNVISILDKTLSTDLKNNKPVNYQDFVNFPKIWVQTY